MQAFIHGLTDDKGLGLFIRFSIGLRDFVLNELSSLSI
jgi:hypothetical protein